MQIWRVRLPQLEEPAAHGADQHQCGQEQVEEVAVQRVVTMCVRVHVDGPVLLVTVVRVEGRVVGPELLDDGEGLSAVVPHAAV